MEFMTFFPFDPLFPLNGHEHMECSAVNDDKLRSFPHTLDTYFQSISDALFSNNKKSGIFIIEDVIKGRPVPEWTQLVNPIKAFIYPELSMFN